MIVVMVHESKRSNFTPYKIYPVKDDGVENNREIRYHPTDLRHDRFIVMDDPT